MTTTKHLILHFYQGQGIWKKDIFERRYNLREVVHNFYNLTSLS